jgi:arginyl-tRNA synthetase
VLADDDRSATSEKLAVALVKYFFLRAPRNKDVVFVEDDLFTKSLPTFLTLLSLYNESHRLSVEPASSASTPSGSGEAELRRLLLQLNVLPDIVEEAFLYLDPAKLVRYLDGLPRLVKKAQQHDAIDPLTWRSIHVVMQHCFHLLNIELPVPVTIAPATAQHSITNSPVGAASTYA